MLDIPEDRQREIVYSAHANIAEFSEWQQQNIRKWKVSLQSNIKLPPNDLAFLRDIELCLIWRKKIKA